MRYPESEHPEHDNCRFMPCAWHGRAPESIEIHEALERWYWRGLTFCVACGRALDVLRYYLRHEPMAFDPDTNHRWEISDVVYREAVLPFTAVTHEAAIHLECARRSLPYALWIDAAADLVVRKDSLLEQP